MVDILLPTCNRLLSLVMTLSGVAAQTVRALRVVVADQSAAAAADEPVVRALFRVIEARGGSVEYHHRGQVHGIAEQRAFLLERARSADVLYLDDDVLMEPWVVQRLVETLRQEGCGFVGAFPAGLSFSDDRRPVQERIEYWDGPVRPEPVEPGGQRWERWQLHRAANLYHVACNLPCGQTRRYKVAWVASCILYDRVKLLDVGGFSFWHRLPRYHSGEEVLVQNLLMRRWGGCGIVPSGTYYAELSSTVLNDAGTVDGHALQLLAEMVEKYCRSRA
jgi:glycosyltransferase involved in cell wall biosynthesis